MKRHRSQNKRLSLEERIQRAKSKKPVASDLNRNGGLTPEESYKLFGSQIPAKTKKILNRRATGKKPNIDSRPKSVIKNQKRPFSLPTPTLLSTPAWFTSTGDADVSIIVPLYRSQKVILDQIESWDLITNDGLKKEIIYVDDKCPNETYKVILNAWQKRYSEIKKPIGKIIVHNSNGGFGCACNTGAEFASGKHLIFLNADCKVTPNWIKPLVDGFDLVPNIGIIGNLQVRNDRIDSAGSEWSWVSKSFAHIGRNSYLGEGMRSSFSLKEAPSELLRFSEREMVTGCCFIIPSCLFHDLEGFDLNYRIGYWEDADLNLRVREMGYKVYFQPASVIHHEVGHSKAGSHPYQGANRAYFYKKWVDNGLIDSMVKAPRPINNKKKITPRPDTPKAMVGRRVVGCVIACNEEEFLAASVKSASPIVTDWIFVIGGNEYAARSGMCTDKGLPKDNTLEIANNLANKYGGKVIAPPGRLWKDKVEMRNAYAQHLKHGDWMFMLDGDEVYKTSQLWKIADLMRNYEVLIMQFWLFWNNINTNGIEKWGQYPQERVVLWKDGYRYRGKNHLHVTNIQGQLVKSIVPTYNGRDKLFYHYSWIRPLEKIKQKLLYYQYQSGIKNPGYIDDVYLKWRMDPESVQGKTHPAGGGRTEPFKGIHPPEVQELIKQGKLNF